MQVAHAPPVAAGVPATPAAPPIWAGWAAPPFLELEHPGAANRAMATTAKQGNEIARFIK
jgi:hypothetical protein